MIEQMKFLRLLIVAALASLSSSVFATTVKGNLTVYVDQGGFCDPTSPLGMDCTDSRYPLSQYQTCQPLRESVVLIVNAGGTVLTSTETDVNGDYSVTFSNPSGGTVAVKWVYVHSDGHFSIDTEGYQTWTASSSQVAAGANQTITRNLCFQDSIYRQAWNGASRLWNEALKYAGVVATNLYGLRIIPESSQADPGRAFYSAANTEVHLGPDSARYAMSDIHHEIGHAAHHFAKFDLRPSAAYNYPTACPTGSCLAGEGWDTSSAEYASVAFQEGLATFVGMVGLYYGSAVQPQFCVNSIGACGYSGNNLEVRSTLASQPCVTTSGSEENRRALSVMRYLWDVLDGVDDSGWVENVSQNISIMMNAVGAFSSGYNDGQVNEPWQSAGPPWVMDAPDGRSATDMKAKFGVSTTQQYNNNCAPL